MSFRQYISGVFFLRALVALSIAFFGFLNVAYGQNSWKNLGVIKESENNKYCYYLDNLLHCGATSPLSVSNTAIGVSSSIYSPQYCDENGQNCFIASAVGGGLWVDETTHISRTGIVAIDGQLGVGLSAPLGQLSIALDDGEQRALTFARKTNGTDAWSFLVKPNWVASMTLEGPYDRNFLRFSEGNANGTSVYFDTGQSHYTIYQEDTAYTAFRKPSPDLANPLNLKFINNATGDVNPVADIKTYLEGGSGDMEIGVRNMREAIYIDGSQESVGIGTSVTTANLTVSGTIEAVDGEVQVSDSGNACDANKLGAIRYDSAAGKFMVCHLD